MLYKAFGLFWAFKDMHEKSEFGLCGLIMGKHNRPSQAMFYCSS